MISFGAVLGKVTPAQIVWLLVLQVPIYAFNAHLVTEASLCIFPESHIGFSVLHMSRAAALQSPDMLQLLLVPMHGHA